MADRGGSDGKPMRLFHHWVAECTMQHMAVVRAARALDAVGNLTGRTAAEAKVSAMTIDLIDRLHSLADLVLLHGPEEVFGPRDRPMTSEERRKMLR